MVKPRVFLPPSQLKGSHHRDVRFRELHVESNGRLAIPRDDDLRWEHVGTLNPHGTIWNPNKLMAGWWYTYPSEKKVNWNDYSQHMEK